MGEGRSEDWTFSIKDLTEKHHVTFTGRGEYFVGLTQACVVAVDRDVENLCIPLLQLTINTQGGCVIASGNKDFPCVLSNGEALSGEVTLVTGLVLDIADRQLQFLEGHVPKPRRKLPRTPGAFIQETPPTKPARRTDHQNQNGEQPETGKGSKEEEIEQCEARLLTIEPGTVEDPHFELQTPDQVAIVAASHFIKQLRMFTDANVTPKVVDDVFKLFVETVESCPDIFEAYAREMVSVMSADRPMHGPAVQIIIEMLKHTLDPVERVVLILDLLRTFSHFDANLPTLVRFRASATVLGTMTALRDVVEVQRFGADILAKIALYQPRLDEKPAIREVAVDVLLAAVQQLKADVQLARSVCRCMANLASAITLLLNNCVDTLAEAAEKSAPLPLSCVLLYENLLQHVFKEGIPVAQSAMKLFSTDVGVCTEGRKLIYFYGKFPQLQQKLSTLKQRSQEPTSEDSDDTSVHWNNDTDVLLADTWKKEPTGIMRSKRRPVKQRGKKIKFADLERSANAQYEADSSENDSSESDNELPGVNGTGIKLDDSGTSCDVAVTDVNYDSPISDTVQQKGAVDGDQSVPEFTETLEQNFVVITPVDPKTDTLSKLTESESIQTEECDTKLEADLKPYNSDSETNLSISDKETTTSTCETDTNTTKDFADNSKYVYDSASEEECEAKDETHEYLPPEVVFLEKLILAQITVYAGTLAFHGNDSQVLMVIDKPVSEMLVSVGAEEALVKFCERQHGGATTLMDVDPSLIISIIDAVRYKSVMTELLRSTVINMMTYVSKRMRPPTIEMAYAFFGHIFSDETIANSITDDKFLQDFHEGLQKVSDKLTPEIVEEIQKRCGFTAKNVAQNESSPT